MLDGLVRIAMLLPQELMVQTGVQKFLGFGGLVNFTWDLGLPASRELAKFIQGFVRRGASEA